MKAYHGDETIKAKYLERVRAHQAADEIVQGYGYWERGRGCAVGCTLHSADHRAYETEMGIPIGIAYLEDRLFERMPKEDARAWPTRFLEAIPVGADLSGVIDHFLFWLLTDANGVGQFAKREDAKAAIARVGALYARKVAGENVSVEEWRNARAAAAAAYAAAAYATAAYATAAYAYAYAAADAAAGRLYAKTMGEKLLELLGDSR